MYKINKYKLLLLIIIEIIALNIFFYIEFAFIKSKYTKNYV